jgi:hypothetical protein
VQIARDDAGSEPADALQARDRELASTLDTNAGDSALLVGWAGELRERLGQRSIGQRVQTAARIVGTLAAVTALALGWAFGEALLAYDGTRPVDAPRYLAVGVGVPAALWLLSVLALVLVRVAPGVARRIPRREQLDVTQIGVSIACGLEIPHHIRCRISGIARISEALPADRHVDGSAGSGESKQRPSRGQSS